jgi:hypothetical protein
MNGLIFGSQKSMQLLLLLKVVLFCGHCSSRFYDHPRFIVSRSSVSRSSGDFIVIGQLLWLCLLYLRYRGYYKRCRVSCCKSFTFVTGQCSMAACFLAFRQNALKKSVKCQRCIAVVADALKGKVLDSAVDSIEYSYAGASFILRLVFVLKCSSH